MSIPRTSLQQKRAWFQMGFFILFVIAPPLDLFRLDLNLGHFILFGFHWTLGIDAFITGEASSLDAAINLIIRGFFPILLIGGLLIWSAWRWGRLYCGWLCPHFSVVEVINRLMLRASGKPSIWERKTLPEKQPDGSKLKPDPVYWIPTAVAIIGFAFLWALTLLTYLLPPGEIYSNLFTGNLTRNQSIFLGVGTLLLSIEFGFARHLFCRFGCAVGLFQSLAWMANDKAMVVGFDIQRATDCNSCNNACDNACPMRLRPRTLKRKMFTCTECGECISACTKVEDRDHKQSLLRWVEGEDAKVVVTGRSSDSQREGQAGKPAGRR
ncbi:4Fe-4S binding protein [Solemya velum gill symbiont]|uniref:4Fe-4S binding protein n=1 Tax=Solemya velum gill symbiont TaxID=2340 RepID=UPI0009963800|nr:4Fe-4S binding protein [Solemya velum gill symbiont]OOY98841.1 4Fe-4S binding protein [Solemya velum gill symbiont]OOZ01126.1 4Fe-4S binding protein [Solemya velum gill symbiont]OOZ03323.1 4Fe-4S binding protein [Solemya velum gill symbiont]OOZ05580.1 4Fe-4S binding protein [Solemya velum gill symbiont]OOZ07813.1 4Fe-4S binding protein [Solemya velum gill symbiont]